MKTVKECKIEREGGERREREREKERDYAPVCGGGSRLEGGGRGGRGAGMT